MISNNNGRISIGRLIVMLCMLLIVVVGGTFAWLTYSSKESALVLTIGNINDTQIKLSPYEITGNITTSTTYTGGVYSDVEVSKGNNNSTSFALFYKINNLDVELIDNGLSYTIVNTQTNSIVKTGKFSSLIDTSKPLPNEVIILDTNTDANLSANTSTYYRVYLWVDSSVGEQSSIQNSTLDVELNGSIGSVEITGTNTYGSVLSSKVNDAVVDKNTSYSYQWYSNSSNSSKGGTAIDGATSSTYTIGKGLVGKYIYLVVTTSKGKTLSDVIDTTVVAKSLNVASLSYENLNKTYDGSTSAPSEFGITVNTSSGLLSGDDVTVGYTGAVYNSVNVVEANTITVSGITLSGDDANNYTLSSTSYGKTGATITAKVLSISAHSDTYNGTTAYSRTVNTGVGSETIVLTYKPYIKNVGNYGYAANAASEKYTLLRTDGTGKASNYSINSAEGFTIGQKTLNVSSLSYSPITKQYDGNTNAPSGFKVTTTEASGLISGDIVAVSYTGAVYNTAAIGNDKTITVSGMTLSGTDAGNYELDTTSYVKTGAKITDLEIIVTPEDAEKVYDGSALTSNACTATGLISGHTVICTMTSDSTITDVGTKTNTISTVKVMSGSTDVTSNYSIVKETGTLTVTKKPLTLYTFGTSYNGTTEYSMSHSTGVGDEKITLIIKPYSKNTGSYTYSETAGSGKFTLTLSDGTGKASNYSIANGGTFRINLKYLTPSVTASNKTYNGNTNATCSVTLNGLISGDNVTVSSTGTFDNKNVGTGKTVTCSSITLKGTDALNYSLSKTSETTTADITAKALTITAKGQTVSYGTAITTGVGQVTVSGLVSGDSLTSISLTPSTTDYTTNGTIIANAAVIKDNNGSGNEMTGNYSITYKTGKLVINKATLTPSVSASNKTYDGNTSATCNVTLTGVASGDNVTASATGTFDNKNVGTGKTVTCSNITLAGVDAVNYNLSETTATTTANITAKGLNIGAHSDTYNGTTSYSRTYSTGVGEETVVLTYVPYSKNAGNYAYATSAASGKYNVTIANGTGAATNYSIGSGGTFTINKKTLTPSVSVKNKVYDGTLNATVSSIYFEGKLSGDTLYSGATCVFLSKKAYPSMSSMVDCSNIYISGPNMGNYTLSTTTVQTSARITLRPITITAKEQTIEFGSTISKTINDVTIGGDGLVTGDSLTAITLAQSTTSYTTDGTITPSGAVIKDSDSSDMTSSYNITYSTGKLVIEKLASSCTISSYPEVLNYPDSNIGEIVYSCTGDGEISVTSSDTSIVSVSNVTNTKATLTANSMDNATITVSITEGNNYKAASDSVDVAVRPSDYTIKYNANGGTGTVDDIIVSYGSYTGLSDGSELSRTGYTFLGWTTNSDGTNDGYGWNSGWSGQWTFKNGQYGVEDGVLQLYARWGANSITFNYYSNNGTQTKFVTWTAAADYVFPDSHWNYTSGEYLQTYTGYTATGYYGTTPTGGTLVHENDVFTSYADLCSKHGVDTQTPNVTVNLYAQWRSDNYKVNFYSNLNYVYHTGSVLAIIAGRTFYKASNGSALVGYLTTDFGTGVILVSKSSSAVSMYDSYDPSYIHQYGDAADFSGSFEYNGVTYYYNYSVHQMEGNHSDTSGLGRVKLSSTYPPDAARELVGKMNSPVSQTFTRGVAQNLTANSFSRTGYSFNGWSNSPAGSSLYTDGQSVSDLTTGDTINLYALWTPITYSIYIQHVYQKNGVWTFLSSSTDSSFYGSAYTPSAVTPPTGYNNVSHFDYHDSSWNWISTGYPGTDVFVVTQEANVQLYYYPKTYTLTVNPNGGSYNGSTSSSTFTQGYDTSKSVAAPTNPSGYTVSFNGNGGTAGSSSLTSTRTFSGWTLSGSGQYVAGSSPVEISGIARNVVTADGGTYENYAYSVSGLTSSTWLSIRYPQYAYTSGHDYEIRFKLRTNSFSGAMVHFRHSATWNDWGTPGLINVTTIGSWTPLSTWESKTGTRTISGTTTTLGSNTVDVVPMFEIYTGDLVNTTSSVNFDLKDLLIIDTTTDTLLQSNTNSYLFREGNGTLTANYTNGSITLPSASRTGYTFNGWYTAASGGTKVGDAGASYTPTAGTTLYAQWKDNSYTIKYNANGGTGSIADQTAIYGSSVTISDGTGISRTGYTFAGWTTKSDGTDDGYNWTGWSGTWSYTNGQYGISSGVLQLYARWTINSYYFDLNWTSNGSSVSSISGVCAGIKINGVDQGCLGDYWQKNTYGSTWEIYGLAIDGVYVPYYASGTVPAYDSGHVVPMNTISFGVNNSSYGSVSSGAANVVSGTTYSTSGNTLTLKYGTGDGRTVTASTKGVTGHSVSFSSWSPTSGTINAATTVTANFSATRTPPTVSVSGTVSVDSITASVTASGNNSATISKISYRLSTSSTCSTTASDYTDAGTATSYTFSNLANGSYYICVRVVDSASGVTTKASSKLTVSLTALGTYLTNNKFNGATMYAGYYRYSGQNSTVTDNYICFGTSTKSTCTGTPGTYMYRIIGVDSSGQVKIIKKTQMPATKNWSTNGTSNWANSTLKAALNGDTYLTNTTYVPSGWSDKLVTHAWKYGDTSAYAYDSSAKISTYVNKETGWTTTTSAKVGLMYVHDWLYGYTLTGTSVSKANRAKGWIHFTNNCDSIDTREHTIARYKKYTTDAGKTYYPNIVMANDGQMTYMYITTEAYRPVVILNASVVRLSGSGTEADPYIIK